ncbi:hypothetical protein SAMN05661010_00049 [Modicisalibacter muralis]|uniref:Ribbon-helix-helix protein, copG family n=1 Tax=Modicisalibacter muralis TaxID=119000 RepID=A0A1G9ENZ3_9GAMM|nr:hypothetical protein [Halomonas muralis]SDK77808.1 hypothetical protein SAMN05661010_00049 [Halomonas muralis]
MYQDPQRVRTRYGSINLDEREAKLIDALVEYTGESKASLLRQLVLKEALESIGAGDLYGTSIDQHAS